MDSGLARFAMLIVLFFLLTGDLTGMVKHLFEEAGYAVGGKQHQQQRTENRQQRNTETDGGLAMDAEGPTPDGDGATDPDLEAFGKSSNRIVRVGLTGWTNRFTSRTSGSEQQVARNDKKFYRPWSPWTVIRCSEDGIFRYQTPCRKTQIRSPSGKNGSFVSSIEIYRLPKSEFGPTTRLSRQG